jgi:hypothetical protein
LGQRIGGGEEVGCRKAHEGSEDPSARREGRTALFGEATGLPMALDMVDELVLVPRGFTRDFAEEVEARIVERYWGDFEAVRVFFQNMNCQKEF